jgi:hypothetical protein
MYYSLYNNGVKIFNDFSKPEQLPGKMGRVAAEINITERMQSMGYTKIGKINLVDHLKACEQLYTKLQRQWAILCTKKNKNHTTFFK